MNLEPTDEQIALRDTVRRFLAERASVAEHVRPALGGAAGTKVWRGLAGLGATGVLVPGEFGGSDMTMSDAAIVAEQIGSALLPEPWLSTAVAAPRAIARFDANAAAADLLTGIADGTVTAAVAPHGESSVVADGTALRGELRDVADANADVLLIVAGETLYRVDADAPGLTVVPLQGIDASRRHFRVELDDVPARALASAAPQVVTAVVDDVWVAAAADALGAAQRLVDMVVDYAKTRVQFGQRIGSFQSVAHLCVDMYETVELTRSGVLHAAWAADAAAAEERHLAALMLKAAAARLTSVGDAAIQVFGGIGFTWEHDAHLYLKRLLSWSSWDGSSDPHLERVGALFVESLRSAE